MIDGVPVGTAAFWRFERRDALFVFQDTQNGVRGCFRLEPSLVRRRTWTAHWTA